MISRPLQLGLRATVGLCLLGYWGWFTSPGLSSYFSADDLMNLYSSWRQPISRHLADTLLFFRVAVSFRPVGALFYSSLFEIFRLDPLPFRIACFLLLAANLWLAYAVARRLSDSRGVGALATLLHAYHGQAWTLYLDTGYCYDLLCLFWYAAAFLYYLRVRQSGAVPGWRQALCWSGLYVLSLGSKEMAVSLPAVILVYELLAHPPVARDPRALGIWLWREARLTIVGMLMTTLFIAGRVYSQGGLVEMQPYRPVFRVGIILDRLDNYLAYALYEPRWLKPAVAGSLVLAVVAAVVGLRSVPLRLGAAWTLIGLLPLTFIPQRNLDAAYVPALGAALFLAEALRNAARGLDAGLSGALAGRSGVVRLCGPAGLVLALLALAVAHGRHPRLDPQVLMPEAGHIRAVHEDLRRRPAAIPKNGEVLFLEDPFPHNEWGSAYLVYLHTQDPTLKVYRVDRLVRDFPGDAIMNLDVVLTWRADQLLECSTAGFRNVTVAELPERARQASCRPLPGN